jgi:hypothetical protein
MQDIVMDVFNETLMSKFRGGRYRLSCNRHVDPKCLYYHELPSPEAHVLSLHDIQSTLCAGSITFEPCMLLQNSIEIFSFTHPDRRRRGINLFLRMIAILVIRTLYPDTNYIVSFAEAEASVKAARRLGFQKYPDNVLQIYILPMTPDVFDRIGNMLEDSFNLKEKKRS